MLRLCGLLLAFCLYASAQGPVPAEFRYHRVYGVVPIIGAGTPADPKRPMFVPSPAEQLAQAEAAFAAAEKGDDQVTRPAVISYSWQVSDDKTMALVEFVGLDPESMKPITTSTDRRVKVFERGKATKAEIETELRKHKQDFALESLAGKAR